MAKLENRIPRVGNKVADGTAGEKDLLDWIQVHLK